jgi:hypothetical protein
MLRALAVCALLGAATVAPAAVARPVAKYPAAKHLAAKHPAFRHPDFAGLWSTASLTSLERPEQLKSLVLTEAQAAAYEKAHRGKPPEIPPGEDTVGGLESEWWETDVGLARIRGQVRSSWLVSPADGQLPITKEAKAFFKARRMQRKAAVDNPEDREASERCIATDGAGPPLGNGGYNDNFEIVQAGDQLAIHAEWMSSLRIIRIGGPGHPPSEVRLASGDSTAHWEGDTLVIETTNFSTRDIDAPNGDLHADMRTVERLSRISPTELLYAFTVTNPAVFSQTWQGEMVLHATKGPLYEYACHEGNYGMANMLAGARHEQAEATAHPAPPPAAAPPGKPAGQ